MSSGLSDVLRRKLGRVAYEVVDRPLRHYSNFVEGFVIYTTNKVDDDIFLPAIKTIFPASEITVRNESWYWVKRSGKTTLLITVENHSEGNGATFFGGDLGYGGIGVTITEHPEF